MSICVGNAYSPNLQAGLQSNACVIIVYMRRWCVLRILRIYKLKRPLRRPPIKYMRRLCVFCESTSWFDTSRASSLCSTHYSRRIRSVSQFSLLPCVIFSYKIILIVYVLIFRKFFIISPGVRFTNNKPMKQTNFTMGKAECFVNPRIKDDWRKNIAVSFFLNPSPGSGF